MNRGRAAATVGIAAVAGLLAAAWAIGLVSVERHVGFFAPAWDAEGRQVYFLQRETWGAVWGPGWEFFSPPASSYAFGDRLSLRRFDPASGRLEVLEVFDGSPVRGRVTKHYRGRIFNVLSARVVPGDEGVEFVAEMDVPRIPTSEHWTLRGTWSPDLFSGAQWTSAWGGAAATPDAVLANGVELMVVPGSESFPCAVVAVEADGRYRVLLSNGAFDALHPDGLSAQWIAERSQRPRIERARELQRATDELTQQYRAQGSNEGEAILRAYDTLEERGYLPRSPRLVAEAVPALPPGVPVFEIPDEYFRVGLFQDVAAAIAAPGAEVKTNTGTYLKYNDDDTGLRLKAWREAGHDRFAVRSEGRLYLLEVRPGRE
jgi:hypothetical protein